jgi:arylsulfatase A-like enzyme
MEAKQKQMTTAFASYWHVLRLIFVIFCLYLAGDAYHRWSGFKYYSTFSEFVPGVALITILFTLVAVYTSFLVWMPLRIITLYSLRSKWSKIDRFLLFLYILPFLIAINAIAERKLVHVELSYQLKFVLFSGVFLMTLLIVVAIERFFSSIKWENIDHLLLFIYSFVLSTIFILSGSHLIWRNVSTPIQLIIVLVIALISLKLWLHKDKTARWIGILQDRITIWVWIFSIWLLLSIPLVIYYNWLANKSVSEKVVQLTESHKNLPNIILVTFDELTSLDMSSYGYYRDTTPFISEWAKKAVLFSRAKTSAPATAPATTSLMTGKRVWNHRIFQRFAYKASKIETENIPLLLKQKGYYNMAYIAADYAILEGSSISNYFDIYQPPVNLYKNNLNLCGRVYRRLYLLFGKNIKLFDWILKPDFILLKFLGTVKRSLLGGTFGYCDTDFDHDVDKQFSTVLNDIDNAPEPFFAWTHLWPPHQPYMPPEPYKDMFVSSLKLKRKDLPVEDSILGKRARYDEYIRFVDEKFKEFIEDRRLKNKMKNTIIILSSDHGMNPNPDLDLSEIRASIPLIMKKADSKEGQVINDLVEQIDIPATILDLANIPIPAWLEGRSLVPLMDGKRLPPKTAFSMNFNSNPFSAHLSKGDIAIWESHYKLIYNIENNKSLLFNLKEDPDEQINLFDKETEIGQRLLTMVLDNLKKVNKSFLVKK